MDRFLTLLGLALSFASLIPVFTAANIRIKVIGGVVSVLLIGVLGTQLWSSVVEIRRLEKAREDVQLMFISNNPLSFEQIYANLNYDDYATASTAVDELVDQRLIHHRPVEVVSGTGAKYVVRVYNSVNWPIP
jgi:hypothetical protein